MSGAPMLARRQLRIAALTALQAANLSAVIEAPGDWVSQPEKMPAVLLRATRGNKEPLMAGPAEYTSTVVLELESRASGITGAAAQDAIDALDFAIEQALLTNQGFLGLTQRTYIDTATEITAEGRIHFGGTKWAIRCEFCEVFDPVYDAPAAVQPVAGPLLGIDLQVDLAGTFDPTGTYPAGTFAGEVTPAPRVAGPDGRDEGGLTINLPQ
jgi:hypothetical protein